MDAIKQVDLLRSQREQKQLELSLQEERLEELKTELEKVQDESHQVELIESMLLAQRAEALKQHPVDEGQEPEIKKVIKEKFAAVNRALSDYEALNEAELNDWNRTRDYARKTRERDMDSLEPCPSRFFNSQKEIEQWNKKKDRVEKDYEKRIKESYRAYEAGVRPIKKTCNDSLKQIFVELEVDLKRFYKMGISKEHLFDFIEIMEKICDSYKGTIPTSYHQKVYKWKQIASELPDDPLKKAQEGEATAKKKLQNELETVNTAVTKAKKQFSIAEKSVLSDEQRLTELKIRLNHAETDYSEKRQTIISQAEEKKKQLYERLEKIRNERMSIETEIEKNRVQVDRYEEEKRNLKWEFKQILRAKLDKKIENKRQEIVQSEDVKSRLEKELSQTPAILFNKRKELNGKIAIINASTMQGEKDIQQLLRMKVWAEDAPHKRLEDIKVPQITQAAEEKAYLKGQLHQLSAFSFWKEKELNEKIAAIDVSIQELHGEVQQLFQMECDIPGRKQLFEKISDIDSAVAQMQEEIQWQIEHLGNLSDSAAVEKLKQVENDAETALNSLDSELKVLKQDITKLEESIPKARTKFETLKAKLDAKQEQASALQDTLKDFHANYLIEKYGKVVKNSVQIKEMKSEIKSLTSSIRELKQEIKKIEQELKKAEKEKKQQLKILQQEQVAVELAKQQQKERQERIQEELLAKEEERLVINEKEVPFERIKLLVQEVENDPNHILLQDAGCPLEDDGKRVITNNIVHKQYAQKQKTLSCERYLLFFVDNDGNLASEQRLIAQKPIGEITATSFELRAGSNFSNGNYYLLILNFDTDDILCAQKYKINISFTNDFDF